MSTAAIFTIVQRRSSRCSRNGFEVSLSGGSRNEKISRSFIPVGKFETRIPKVETIPKIQKNRETRATAALLVSTLRSLAFKFAGLFRTLIFDIRTLLLREIFHRSPPAGPRC